MIRVAPLKPVCGSYECSLAEAEYMDEKLDDRDGVVVKVKVPMRRYLLLVATTRQSRKSEFDLWKAGHPPENMEFTDDGRIVTILPPTENRTALLPQALAESLIARGLCERVPEEAGSLRVNPRL
jgi:hypothetical protein